MISRSLVWMLALLLVASALMLVTAQHRARSLFVDLERSQQTAKQLDIEFDRLKIEQARLTQPALIERAALKMGYRAVDGSRTVYLNLPQATSSAPVTAGRK